MERTSKLPQQPQPKEALSSAKTSRSEDRLSKLLEQQEIQGDEDDLMM
jgi:hypothetical protein